MDENHVQKMQLAISVLLEEPDDLNSALESKLRLFRDKLHVMELERAIGWPPDPRPEWLGVRHVRTQARSPG